MDLRELHTGLGVVDQAVNEALSGVKGFPMRRRLAVTRRYEGGVVVSDVVTTTFDDFKIVDLPPEALAVPSGYRYQEPIISFPGL
jgi:DNA-binding transcriptional regulator YdaS (Cro superfamily)